MHIDFSARSNINLLPIPSLSHTHTHTHTHVYIYIYIHLWEFIFPAPPVTLSILWGLFQVHQLPLVSPPPSCSIAVFVLLSLLKYLSLIFNLWSAGTAKSSSRQLHSSFLLFFFFSQLLLGQIFWPGLGDLFVAQNPREIHASHSTGLILVYACTI